MKNVLPIAAISIALIAGVALSMPLASSSASSASAEISFEDRHNLDMLNKYERQYRFQLNQVPIDRTEACQVVAMGVHYSNQLMNQGQLNNWKSRGHDLGCK